jgi:hypothetical protein
MESAVNANEKTQQISQDSDELMDALSEMKRLEGQKRTEEFSSPPFHDLAQRVTEQSRRVFEVASREQREGEDVEQTGDTINDESPRG